MRVTALLDAALTLAAVPALLASAYLFLLALLSRRPEPPACGPPRIRFDLIVPAHDEEAGIGDTVRSLASVEYPAALRRLWVVADNCSDATADRARDAGALVLVRTDRERLGKGYALAHAFERSLGDGFADAVVVVDADTAVSSNLLRAFAARIEAGATAVQANDVVGNRDASWRTRLMAVAFALVNTVRSLARERLRCSTGLRGNGMCLATSLLRQVPYDAFSLVEDVEYGIRLGLSGHRVHFAAEAAVASVMVTTARAARSQRLRWEGGRARLAREQGFALVGRGLRRRDRVLIDLGLDLLVPPLAYLALVSAIGTGLAWAAAIARGPMVAPWAWSACLAAIAVYVGRGWSLSGTGIRGLASILYGPVYVLWKVALAARAPRHGSRTWIRTHRESGGRPVPERPGAPAPADGVHAAAEPGGESDGTRR